MDKAKEAILNEEYRKSITRGMSRYSFIDLAKCERLGIKQFKSQVGDNFIRIVTPDISKFWAKEIFYHGKIGVNQRTFICSNKMYGKPCAVCEHLEALRLKNPDDERIAELNWSTRWLFFVYDVRDLTSASAKGLHYYDAPSTVKDGITGGQKVKRTGQLIEVESPTEGRDIEFTKTGSGLGTKYINFVLVDRNPIPQEWTMGIPDFLDIVISPDYDVVKGEVVGIATSTNSEEFSSEVELGDSPKDVISQGSSVQTEKAKSAQSSSIVDSVKARVQALKDIKEGR